jgi:hypothetical protein
MPAVLGDSGGPVLALGLEVLATAVSREADAAYGAAGGAPGDAGRGADGAAGGPAGAATVDDAGGAGGDAGSSSTVATPVLIEVGGEHIQPVVANWIWKLRVSSSLASLHHKSTKQHPYGLPYSH